MSEHEWIVSVDDHAIEPPNLWVDRVPARDRDRAPRPITGDDGVMYWTYESARVPIARTTFQAAMGVEEASLGYIGSYDELDVGFYDSVARTKAMDRDSVLAALCFPLFPRYCGQTFYEAKDKDFALVCLQAYNDWMIDEWCGSVPGRFIPLVIVPLWDPALAAAEVHRCAAKGAKAIAFSENPYKLGLPSLHDAGNYWDPLLAAANETKMPLCIHFGSSSSMPKTSPDAPLLVTGTLAPTNLISALVDWIFSGKLIDGDISPFPDLKICLSEGGIGWIPYILERCDMQVKVRPYLARGDWQVDAATGAKAAITTTGGRRFGVPPSEVFRRHIYGCFIEEEFGARQIEQIGVDNVMLETDYPHGDSSFPNSLQNAQRRLAYLSDEARAKVMRGNACRVFDFEPAAPPF
jgi:predicted TIM-barrel fold metal-dependent hydrolase